MIHSIQFQVVLLGITCLAGIFPCRPAAGQVPAHRFPIVTQSDPQASRLYQSILGDLQTENLERAVEKMQSLRNEFPGQLIPIDGFRVLETSLLIDLLALQLPEERSRSLISVELPVGQSTWRASITGRITLDELMKSGDRAWQTGEIETARRNWQLIESFRPQNALPTQGSEAEPDSLRLEILMRLIVSESLLGRVRTARKRLREFAAEFPDETGEFAGGSGVLTETVNNYLEATYLNADENFVPTANIRQASRYDLVRRKWSTDVRESDDFTPVMPSVWNEVVLIHDQNGIRGLNLETGKSAWPVDEQDAGFLLQTEELIEERVQIPFAQSNGIVMGDLWIGRTGISRFALNRIRDELQRSRIFALDLNAEGRIDWTIAANDIRDEGDQGQWIFSGRPYQSGEHLIIPMRSSHPDCVLKLLCVDGHSGETVWSRTVGSTLGEEYGSVPVFDDQILVHEHQVFWNVNRQAIVCADVRTGTVNWITSHSSPPPLNPTQSLAKSERLSGPLFAIGQRLFAITGNGICVLDSQTGERVWTLLLETAPQYVLGEVDGVLIAAGPGVIAIDADSGDILWQYDDVSRSHHAGQGVLSGQSIIWPTGTELWTIDSQTGHIRQRDFFEELTGLQCDTLEMFGPTLLVNGESELSGIEVDRTTLFGR